MSKWNDLVGPFTLTPGPICLVTSDGENVYPASQFDGDTIIDGVENVLTIFSRSPASEWTIAGWFATKHVHLDNKNIYEWLIDGGDQEIAIELAKQQEEDYRS